MKPLRVTGLSALGLLLVFCSASTSLESALGQDTTGPVYLDIKVPEAVYADERFNITLQVARNLTVGALTWGYLYHENETVLDKFSIYFDTSLTWNSTPIEMRLSAGNHTLVFRVDYRTATGKWTDTFEKPIVARLRLPSYKIVWLQRPEPDEPIRAGKLIRLRFSIVNASGSFVQSDDVRIVVEGTDVEATCGRKSGSIRINTNREYYRWYWKTDSDLPGGVYSIIVLLDSAELGSTSITIVSKN